jgi:DNA-binding NtrC family response regulator
MVDDNVSSLKALETFLGEEGYEVVTTTDPKKAETLFKEGPPYDIVLSDLKMPGIDGLELFHRLKSVDRQLLFIIMTAHGTIESSVKALKEGVYDYLLKPINIDELSIVLEKSLRERKQATELNALRKEVKDRYGFDNIVSRSPKMYEVFSMLRAVSPTDATVLVTGETGTGKELITKAIHYNSLRHDGPFICINCAALSEQLLEAELFGYVKGAFTGATSNRIGRLEAAHWGTLFLDEVGQMSMPLQAKLLRFLQERTFEPVGSVDTRTVDVRIIAATNRNLQEEVEKGHFLLDFFYRLQVIQILIPPLRERRGDIPLLVNTFLKQAAAENNRPVLEVAPDAMESLMTHSWPGNVRELRNIIDRLVILTRHHTIRLADLPENIRYSKDPLSDKDAHFIERFPANGIKLKHVERELIKKTLNHFQGNRSKTAKALGISRKSLYERMQRSGLT